MPNKLVAIKTYKLVLISRPDLPPGEVDPAIVFAADPRNLGRCDACQRKFRLTVAVWFLWGLSGAVCAWVGGILGLLGAVAVAVSAANIASGYRDRRGGCWHPKD